MRGIRGPRRTFSLELVLFGVASISILAGASFNVQGYTGETGLIAILAGLLAFAAGVLYRRWLSALFFALAGLGLHILKAYLVGTKFVGINLTGMMGLLLGGGLAAMAYSRVTEAIRRRVRELEHVNARLEEQRRVFLAATEEAQLGSDDVNEITAHTAQVTGAGFCCYYLASPDGNQFRPQLPGFGFDLIRPPSLSRMAGVADPVFDAVDARQELYLASVDEIAEMRQMLPANFKAANVLIVPLLIRDQVGGFVLLGNRMGGFSPDVRRLAGTLAARAGVALASRHAVAEGKEAVARYTVLNQITAGAVNHSFAEVIDLVVEKARQLVSYDAARVAVFDPEGTYTILGSSSPPTAIAPGPLEPVLVETRTVIRRMLTSSDGLFSGLRPHGEGGQVAEALIPIVGARTGVLGAICLGRLGGLSFSDRDLPTLDELGTVAGAALESSAGTAVRPPPPPSSPLPDWLEQIGQVLNSSPRGLEVVQTGVLAMAGRLAGCKHVLLTTAAGPGVQRIRLTAGFPAGLQGRDIRAGQGLIGGVAAGRAPLAIPDILDSFEQIGPPDLAAYGLRAALCVPMMRDGEVAGCLAVFGPEPRSWTAAETERLATFANLGAVAQGNAELHAAARRTVRDLGSLHGALAAITTCSDLEEALEVTLGWAAKLGEAELGCLALLEDGHLQVGAAVGWDQTAAGQLALEMGGEICRHVLDSGEAALEHSDPTAGESGPLHPLAVLCLPFKTAGRPLGVVFLANHRQGRIFSEDHRRLVAGLLAEAAVAVENAYAPGRAPIGGRGRG